MLHIIAVSFLCAVPSKPLAQLKLAAPDLAVANVPEAVARVATDRIAQRLASFGPRIVTTADITAAIGLERQRQLLGCSQDSSQCLAELAGALGVDGIVVGSLGRFGEAIIVNLKVVSTAGEAWATYSGTAPNEAQLPEMLDQATLALARQLGLAESVEPSGRSRWWLAPAIGGGVLLAGGGVLALVGDQTRQRIPTSPDAATAFQLRQTGEAELTTALVLTACAAAALVVAGTSFALSDGSTAHAALAPAPNGVAFEATFP